MSLQQSLPQSFIRAIELEQKCDMLQTTNYLSSFTPRQLVTFGLAIINLSADSIRPAFAGKTTFELSLDRAFSGHDDQIQPGSMKVGDIVRLSRMNSTSEAHCVSLDGVITRLNEKALHISITDEDADEIILSFYNNTSSENNLMWVAKLTNSITYKRMLQAMKRVQCLSQSEKSEIIQILLGERNFIPRNTSKIKTSFLNQTLNQSQKDAIQFSIEHSPITIIHGPPGTGKTHTLIELIQQLHLYHKEKILVCGASNTSVDNIIERLSPLIMSTSDNSSQKKSKKRTQVRAQTSKLADTLIRIGHPARLLPSNLKHSLDILSRSNLAGEGGDFQAVLNDIHGDIRDTLSAIEKCKIYSERKLLWSELKRLKKELRDKEKAFTQELIVRADIIVSTLHGAGSNELRSIYKNSEFSVDNPLFDTIIIDEVSQSSEPQCWIPLVNHLGCRRLVIAGDNQQLPPTIKSSKEVLKKVDPFVASLDLTLFDRLINGHGGDKFKKLLNVQYRMNEEIMAFSSRNLYENRLTADETVKSILLSDLKGVAKTDETDVPCIWYDTQGGNFSEQMDDEKLRMSFDLVGSKFNEMEAAVTINYAKTLILAGVSSTDIGIISPYSAQVSIIKKLLFEEDLSLIEASTIDGFQGREKEAIILTLVRSNDLKEVGFLNDSRRLNVAMTRSKRQICVIGDMELLEQSGVPFLRDWAKHAYETFEVRYPNPFEC